MGGYWLVVAVGARVVGIGAAVLVLGVRGLFIGGVGTICRVLAVAAVLVLSLIRSLVIQTNHLLRALFLTVRRGNIQSRRNKFQLF